MHMVGRIAGPASSDWAKWINNDDGSGEYQIDTDADGVFTSSNRILIDLSHALSIRLGRQMPMMATYKVNYVRIELCNHDDANDNDSGADFNGLIHHWTPTKHRIDAMQMARQLEKITESTDIDADSFLLTTERDYTGMRFNWDQTGQVQFATAEDFSALAGTEWDLGELFSIYSANNADSSAPYANALWNQGRCGYPDTQGFAVSYVNDTAQTDTINDGHNPQSRPFSLVLPKGLEMEVLGGLMMLDFTHSSTDSPINTIDDDYNVRVTVGVSGWSDF